MAAARALVIGEALVDVTRRADGSVAEHPGGSPLNVAVTMARVGIDTTLVSQVGDDEFGSLIRAHLDDSGVALVSADPPGPTASATATLDSSGAATYDFDLRWDPAWLPEPTDFDLLHVGSIGSWMPPGSEAVADLVRRARSVGTAVGFDPNIRLTLAPDVDRLRTQVLDLAGLSRFLKLSDEDAEVLARGGASPHDVLVDLSGRGPALVALTQGGRSALLRSGDQEVELQVPRVHVVDSIGAGDTWMGTLLAELLTRGWAARTQFQPAELQTLGEAAVEASAITVSRPGADPPWRHERSPG
jgi:fructokinase